MSVFLNSNLHKKPQIARNGIDHARMRGGAAGRSQSSVLATHVAYLVRGGFTAVLRPAGPDDRLAVARLVARGTSKAPASSSDHDRQSRKERISGALRSMNDRMSIIHVVELEGRACAAGRVQVAGGHRLFASETVISASGKAFDPDLAMRIAEHVVQCCAADGWPALQYFADFDDHAAAMAFAAHFQHGAVATQASEARLGLVDKLRYPRRSHRISFTFGSGM